MSSLVIRLQPVVRCENNMETRLTPWSYTTGQISKKRDLRGSLESFVLIESVPGCVQCHTPNPVRLGSRCALGGPTIKT